MSNIGFIGAGPVGTAFAVNLSQRGYPVTGVFDVVKEAAQRFADDVSGCQVYEKAQELADSADMVFVTTPDDIIPRVTAELAWRAGQSVVHCSGAST
ncbi:MAG: NAD(P)-binding domain-containing protein, partial [Dehalococcoidales bacterium]